MLITAVVFGLVAIASSLAIASLDSGGWLRRRLPTFASKVGWWEGQDSWAIRASARRWLVVINVFCVLALLVLAMFGR
jgi:hypothetical protein